MPFRYLGDLRVLKDRPHFGSGECVDLVKELVPGLKGVTTQSWKQGASVKDLPNLARGTAIATFGPDGKFPTKNTGQHAAIFVAHAGAGIWVVEQYRNSKYVLYRHMGLPQGEWKQRPDGTWPQRSKNPYAFSVIER
jgi:hypothetical protein